MTDDFVHLHVHTEYSMLDGAASLARLVQRAETMGVPALAITDHGNLHGAYKFYNACSATNVKPIIGAEFYVAPGFRANTERVREDGFSGGGSYSHLTVIARNAVGLRNLYRLSTQSYTQGFYQKPRTDLKSLEAMGEGLLILSGCLGGELATRLKYGQPELADKYLDHMKSTFGEHFYVEVMDHDFQLERDVLALLLERALRHDIPVVATNDSHYVSRSDPLLHDAMLCLQTRSKLADEKRMKFDGSGYYLKSRTEMEATTILPPESLNNTLLVASSVESYGDVFDHRLRMPVSGYADPEAEIYRRVLSQLDPGTPEYDQATYELLIICRLGFADYFLVLSDLVRVAKSRSISVGPGRGSAAGSYVSYLLGITGLDPMEFDLSFERFLNADRVSLPDIDIDIPDDQRDEVVQIAREMYGQDRAARIGTIGTIGARAAIKDAAFVLGYPYKVGDAICGALPPPVAGRAPALSELNEDKIDLRVVPEDTLLPILGLAEKLEGLVRQPGQHAAGVVISPEPLDEIMPLWKQAKPEYMVTTQWDMHAVEELGLVKFDLLGLANLAIIDGTVERYELGNLGLELGTRREMLKDERTYDMLCRGESVGVFQLDGRGMQNLLRRLRPRTIDDIAAVLALYRPGPMGVNAHWEYADRKNGRKPVLYPHPEFRERLSDILGPTYGLIVYQEQVTATLVELCGYTVNEADSVRKAMGKKDRELLDKERERVLSTPGYSREALQSLWDILVPFADYAFNRAHAYGYAIISFWTAHLKARFPAEYFSTVLTKEKDVAKVREYMDEVRRLGIAILPPDVNTSDVHWTATREGLRFGMGTIKGVGTKVLEGVVRNRPYRSWGDFLRKSPAAVLKTNVVAALCQAGALDSLGKRESIWAVYEDHITLRREERDDLERGEVALQARTYRLPSRPTDFAWRKKQEKDVLGLAISEKPVLIIVPSGLSDTDWEYLRGAVLANPGMSQLLVRVGPWTMPYGLVDSQRILRSLKPLGGEEVEGEDVG